MDPLQISASTRETETVSIERGEGEVSKEEAASNADNIRKRKFEEMMDSDEFVEDLVPFDDKVDENSLFLKFSEAEQKLVEEQPEKVGDESVFQAMKRKEKKVQEVIEKYQHQVFEERKKIAVDKARDTWNAKKLKRDAEKATEEEEKEKEIAKRTKSEKPRFWERMNKKYEAGDDERDVKRQQKEKKGMMRMGSAKESFPGEL
jgi:hypothetical protein